MLKQEELIGRVKEKSAADARINAVLMYGSFTQGCGDEFSDVEFYLFVEDDALAAFDSAAWIAEVHPFYNHFYNEFGTEVVIFTNLVRGEFHVLPVGEMSVIDGFVEARYFPDVDSMVLHDREGKLEKAVEILRNIDMGYGAADAESAMNNLLNNLLYGINVWKRGELARAVECLNLAGRCFLQAVRLAEGKTEHFLNPQKNLEHEISPRRYAAFARCTSALDREGLGQAYGNLVREGRKVARELGEGFGIGSQDELYARLQEYLG